MDVEEYEAALAGRLDYAEPRTSFSPCWSRVGASFDGSPGVAELVLFYNRRPTTLGKRFIATEPIAPGALLRECRPSLVTASSGAGGTGFVERVTFPETDLLHYWARGARGVRVRVEGPEGFPRRVRLDEGVVTVTGEFPRSDGRDPDPTFPVVCAVAFSGAGPEGLAAGSLQAPLAEGAEVEVEGPVEIALACEGETTLACAFGVGRDDPGEAAARARRAVRLSPEAAHALCRGWLAEAVAGVEAGRYAPRYLPLAAHCVHTLLSNTVVPHGNFTSHAFFPNRAHYCSHYLWDSCFVSLAVGRFLPDLAAGALRILADNQGPDGKVPQFVCATWVRPGESQPPLLGWAARRLGEGAVDRSLALSLYRAMSDCDAWWMTARDPDGDGLAEWNAPIESGWDDTPRGDAGAFEAVDLNCYLREQRLALAELAERLGRPAEAGRWRERAKELEEAILTRLYDRETGLFFDRRGDTGEFIRVKTPACFMPLAFGLRVDERVARRMIEEHLLDEEEFFGPYPFPCVAYDEPSYDPGRWWRGPVWVNIAYLMTEALGRWGYQEERLLAMRRLVGMVADGVTPWENYNSRTGEGQGTPELGWTAAVTLLWLEELSSLEE